ncbi:MAG: cbb3-type cytochrome oxidase assembly protein CcoS [Ekhidna sp.]|nr:cbb3-type cytochrome oxidase assembly protein CcoS [Ekhidna sp.]MBC6410149.1 cbb3-type cytochrome oxidase assembly protein CcoS [Ekhidna sp.]
MSVIFILIGCSLLLSGSFLAAFLWAGRSGQFEDDYTPSVRMLFEDVTNFRTKDNHKEPDEDSRIKSSANAGK